MIWVNIYSNPRVETPNHEFEGKPHPTKEEADFAAREELRIEGNTRLVRQEEREG